MTPLQKKSLVKPKRSRPSSRTDLIMKDSGWTHRLKGKPKAYLKQQEWRKSDKDGRSYVDMEQQFHWYSDEQVVPL